LVSPFLRAVVKVKVKNVSVLVCLLVTAALYVADTFGVSLRMTQHDETIEAAVIVKDCSGATAFAIAASVDLPVQKSAVV
jgi:hypothetical protein